MSDLINWYENQARQGLSSLPWIAELQTKAMRELKDFGFPNRHEEEWKYTRIDPLVQYYFNRPAHPAQETIASDLPLAPQIRVQNGQILGIEELELPAGVIIQPLFQALKNHEVEIKPYLDQLLKHEHGFHALNTALFHTGLFIYVPEGIQIEQPLVISHWQDKEQAVHSRHLIIAKAKSQFTVIEDYYGAEESRYFTNTITEIWAGEQTQLNHYKIQRESKAAFHIGQLAVVQEENSQFNSHSLSLGGKLVRSDIDLRLQREKAACFLNGIYMPTEGQHIDHHTTVHHLVPNCQSQQDYKGILSGRSHAVFNGKVIVAKDAQHTEANQSNKNLLLSEHSEIDTKPQLEIFADDVICTHGATVGQLDEEALFYLATRGINRQEASQFLIHAFTHDNLSRVPHRQLASWMETLLVKQLR